MKILIRLNYIALLIPFIVALGGLADEYFLIYAAFSTVATGAAQVFIAIAALIMNHRSTSLYIYFSTTALFFALWVLDIGGIIWLLPPFLAIYLTVVLHRLKEQPLVS